MHANINKCKFNIQFKIHTDSKDVLFSVMYFIASSMVAVDQKVARVRISQLE